MTDAIRLTLPHARAYYGVVRLVLGGLAARHDLPYEELEDLQIALETLLATDAYVAGGDVTVEVALDDGVFELSVGPLDARQLDSDLARDADVREGIGLGRLLSTVAGRFEMERRGDGEWVRMRKDVPTTGSGVR